MRSSRSCKLLPCKRLKSETGWAVRCATRGSRWGRSDGFVVSPMASITASGHTGRCGRGMGRLSMAKSRQRGSSFDDEEGRCRSVLAPGSRGDSQLRKPSSLLNGTKVEPSAKKSGPVSVPVGFLRVSGVVKAVSSTGFGSMKNILRVSSVLVSLGATRERKASCARP